jgi:hypothetical protein
VLEFVTTNLPYLLPAPASVGSIWPLRTDESQRFVAGAAAPGLTGVELAVDDEGGVEIGSVAEPLSEVLVPQAVTAANAVSTSPQAINRRVMGAPPTTEGCAQISTSPHTVPEIHSMVWRRTYPNMRSTWSSVWKSRRRVKAEPKSIAFRATAAQPFDDRCLS